MSILTVMQGVSLAIGLAKPTVVYTATSREWLELQSLANEAAAVIVDAFDWQELRKVATVTGDGVANAFDLPTDYGRMLMTASLWSSKAGWSIDHVASADDWLAGQQLGNGPWGDQWTVYGSQIHVRPTMVNADTLKFFYIRNTIVKSGSDLKTAFEADDDAFVLDERLLKLCLIYLWKQQKGFDFTAELADYEQALSLAMDRNGGSKPKLSGNPGARRSNVWPGTVSG